MMFLHIREVTIRSICKGSVRIVSFGGSVAKATAAKVSIMMLIQRSWTATKEGSFSMQAPKKTMNMTEMLTVS